MNMGMCVVWVHVWCVCDCVYSVYHTLYSIYHFIFRYASKPLCGTCMYPNVKRSERTVGLV